MSNTALITSALLLLVLPAGTFLIGGLLLDAWVPAGLAAFFVLLLGMGLAQASGLGETTEEEEV